MLTATENVAQSSGAVRLDDLFAKAQRRCWWPDAVAADGLMLMSRLVLLLISL